jgi:hypothetical protein
MRKRLADFPFHNNLPSESFASSSSSYTHYILFEGETLLQGEEGGEKMGGKTMKAFNSSQNYQPNNDDEVRIHHCYFRYMALLKVLLSHSPHPSYFYPPYALLLRNL